MAEVNLEENLKRKTVNRMDEARGYANFTGHFHRTEESIAEGFGVTRDIDLLSLLSFRESIQEPVAKGELTPSHAETISTAPSDTQVDLARTAIEKGWTVARTTEEAKRLNGTQKLN